MTDAVRLVNQLDPTCHELGLSYLQQLFTIYTPEMVYEAAARVFGEEYPLYARLTGLQKEVLDGGVDRVEQELVHMLEESEGKYAQSPPDTMSWVMLDSDPAVLSNYKDMLLRKPCDILKLDLGPLDMSFVHLYFALMQRYSDGHLYGYQIRLRLVHLDETYFTEEHHADEVECGQCLRHWETTSDPLDKSDGMCRFFFSDHTAMQLLRLSTPCQGWMLVFDLY